MKKNIMIGLALVLFIPACSQKSESSGALGTPQFQITAADVTSVSVHPLTLVKTGRKIGELDVVFANGESSKFQQFAKKHFAEKVQFVVGTNVISETRLNSELAKNGLMLSYSTIEEAQVVADSLPKK